MSYVLRPLVAFPSLVLGVVLMAVGLMLLADVGELSDRTERTIATVEGTEFSFTTIAGVDYTLPLLDTCKRAEPPPKRGCLERYETDDEVLVWYDNTDPTHTWEGATPGGGKATAAFYAGIVLVTWGLFALYFLFLLARIKAGLGWVGDIARRQPR